MAALSWMPWLHLGRPGGLRRLLPDAPLALQALLDVRLGVLPPPLRSEIFGPARFAQHGRSLGLTHGAAPARLPGARFFPRLRANIEALREAHRYMAAQAASGYDISPAAEWLLDNFHLIETQLAAIHEGLPRSYFRRLPVLQAEPLAGLPRVYGVAWAFVAHTDSAFDEDLLVGYLQAYQTSRELQLGEMWALPTTLRVVLVENLRRLAERVAAHKAAREAANLCCDRIAAWTGPALAQLDDLMQQRGVGGAFRAQLMQRLQDRQVGGSARREAHFPPSVQAWLQALAPDGPALQQQQAADQTADNLSVSNAVRSLRAIDDADWPDIVARSSPLMQSLMGSPLFAAEHSGTRDQTLHSIEALARRCRRSEGAVTQALLALMAGADAAGPTPTPTPAPAPAPAATPAATPAAAAPAASEPAVQPVSSAPAARPGVSIDTGADTPSDPSADPTLDLSAALSTSPLQRASHWLQGPGRPQLAAALGLRAHPLAGWAAGLRRAALPLYLGLVLVCTTALMAWILQRQGVGLAGGVGLLTGLCMLLPASEAVVAVVHRLVSESKRPTRLPRLALAGGIPAGQRVLVAIPTLITSAAGVAQAVHRLHLHALANPEAHTQFALLTDWADAASARAPGDEPLLASAVQALERLNAAAHLPAGSPPRYLLLHRRRQFCTTESSWMGWERKRGKLQQLVAVLAGDTRHDFLDLGELSRLAPGTVHVLTLDSDTQLPPGGLRDLIAVAAHPHNRPQLDAAGRCVSSGYGVLQPHLVTPLPTPAERTPLHWLFAGQCGIDPYSAASSEVYQDLFGEGSFTGKGLLHVQAAHAVLGAPGRALPVDSVLSHDLLEGSLLRCAAVTDVSLIEEAPSHADVAASRLHRWTRGDWQLLPFLLPTGWPERWLRTLWPSAAQWAPGARRYPLRAINRWKLLDNLRRSLVAPASLGLVVLSLLPGLAGRTLSPLSAVLLVLAAFSAGPLMGAVAAFAPSRDTLAKRHFYRGAALGLGRALLGGLWHLTMLLQQAGSAVDAIGRTLWRVFVSRRHLLQWTTADAAARAASAAAGQPLWAAWRRHPLVPAAAAALALALLAAGTPAPGWTLALCALWAGAPLWAAWASRARPEAAPLAAEDRAFLQGVARDTWRYFERCISADDHHLPPDNLQTHPHEMLARRTSPTNIGLYLLATACARAFGWIGTAELVLRLHNTLATLDTMQRHRGHFLNWYDTATALPLLPMYVSTVDSGNLCGHLLAVGQACRERAAMPEDRPHAAGLLQLAERCEALAWAADFSFLYHPKRHLLHIGYRLTEQTLDAGFYDLLASESRLTSLLALAKGDVPVRHWAALGRPFFAVGATAGLLSWSGSMFEYLMPTLVLAEPDGSVLHDATHAALREHMRWARGQGMPWGVSESAHAGCDHTLAYQYAPQGAPRLALRRTPPDERVVAPYATALAAQVDAVAACRNFEVLQALGARGDDGFVEALDFTAARQTGTASVTVVYTRMAHHQGMSIVALANVLLDGVAQRWGMANPQMAAVACLLHERAPREVPLLPQPPAQARQVTERRAPALQREVVPGEQAVEPTQLLGNGHYQVALRANGAGHSRRGALGITRWRDDALRDEHGHFFYLRRHAAQPLVSLSQHPAPDPSAHYQAQFHADRVCLDATWPDLRTRVTTWVSPEDDIEFRQVELRNPGQHTLELELVSALEPTLADPRADEAHPAFSNLFIGARWWPAAQALVFERRPRLAGDRGLHMAHFLTEAEPAVIALAGQVDRALWRGRLRTAANPQGLLQPLPGTAAAGDDGLVLDTGLDPACVLAVRLRIAPGARARLTFATAACDDAATLAAVVDKYRQAAHVQRASLMSATLAGIRMRALRLGADELAAIQLLTTALLLGLTRQVAAGTPAPTDPGPAGWAGAPCDRRLLWRMGLSGERPLLLVSASALQGLGLLRSLARALRVWGGSGLGCDLVIVNAEPVGYQMALQQELVALRERLDLDSAAQPADQRVGLHLVRSEDLSADEAATLSSLARVTLQADGRPLAHHVQAWARQHDAALQDRQNVSSVALVPAVTGPAAADPTPRPAGPDAAAGPAAPDTPHGAFTDDGAYRLQVQPGVHGTPRPWINVLANPVFGALLSESGGGYTWAGNSRLHQLTAWRNDPVADPAGETFLLQDLRSLEVWSLAPGAWGDARLPYRVEHGQGYTLIEHQRGDLWLQARWCVDPVLAVKQLHLRIHNRGPRRQRLRVSGIVEWLLGASRADRQTLHTARHRALLAPDAGRTRELLVLLATQREPAGGFGQGTAFLAMSGAPGTLHDWTCDRRETLDARGQPVLPDHWLHAQGSGLDPCAAMSQALHLDAGERHDSHFWLGHAASPTAARALAVQAASAAPALRESQARQGWDALLGASTVATPDPLFDVLVNRWLLYQTVACRLWARTALYQAGGAMGFRDQLQDTLALAWAAPQLLRAQIVLCAGRQFAEGDVQHWWHMPGGAGVRTHFSDDLLWLPHACLHYLRATGDQALLDEVLPFIEGQVIPDQAEDVYGIPRVSDVRASLYEHAARTLDRSLRVGAHGLPLMGSGDWNDGMNRVGVQGRGESVWLGWFLCDLVARFAPLARSRGDEARAQTWLDAAARWQAALVGTAWDGQWYTRAYFDDGSPLGSQHNAEARIDLIAQAWAVLSGAAPAEQQATAMASVQAHLADPEHGVLRLLHPPLAQAEPSAGYIQAYPPGVRENGGQYTHAAVWAVMAQARLASDPGLTPAQARTAADRAWQWFTWCSPAHRSASDTQGPAYGLEPYAVAADVYSQAPWAGRGGWSWYTGSAGWLHRAALESILGLQLEADTLSLQPCLPSHWPRAELTLKRDGRSMRFVLLRAAPGQALVASGLADSGARALAVGEPLAWRHLPATAVLVVGLPL